MSENRCLIPRRASFFLTTFVFQAEFFPFQGPALLFHHPSQRLHEISSFCPLSHRSEKLRSPEKWRESSQKGEKRMAEHPITLPACHSLSIATFMCCEKTRKIGSLPLSIYSALSLCLTEWNIAGMRRRSHFLLAKPLRWSLMQAKARTERSRRQKQM